MSDIRRKIIRASSVFGARTALFACLATFFAGCQQDQHPPAGATSNDGFTIVGLRENGTLEDGMSVALTNSLGDLRVRNQPGPDYVVSAQIQKLGGETRDVTIAQQLIGGKLMINVVAPDGFNGRADTTLLVPDEHALTLATDDGLIQARINENAINAKSVSGKIAVRGLADLDLETTDGPIEVTVHRLGGGNAEIKTSTGNITIQMPPESNLRLVAETGGTFATALAPDVKRSVKQTAGRLEVALGAGKAQLHVTSESGEILLKSYGYEGARN